MKGKIRFTKILISMVIILNLCVSNVCAYYDNEQNVSMVDSKSCLGKSISLEDVNAAFADEIDYGILDEFQFERAISVCGDDVSVNLSLLMDSSEIKLQYDGKLYKSFRHTNEKPVYIGVFENESTVINQDLEENNDLTNNIEIIYFEISNDNSPYNLNKDLRESSSITMYLRNEEGTIYDLGSEIMTPIILEGVENQAPSNKDINWFLDFFKGTYNEEQNNTTRSTYSTTWAGDLHTLRYQIADYEHIFLATPYIDFGYGDVPYAGETTFSMSLKISESHRYRLVGSTNWTVNTGNYSKCFAIDNVQLAWTAGGNTEIKYVLPHLNTANQGGGSFNFVGLSAAVTGLAPQTAPLSSILTLADSILSLSEGDSESFTNTHQGGALYNTSAYKIKFPANYYIEESGYGLDNPQAERFEYNAIMATSNSNLSRSYWTYAVADFTFRIGWADITGQSGSKVYTGYKELGYYNNY